MCMTHRVEHNMIGLLTRLGRQKNLNFSSSSGSAHHMKCAAKSLHSLLNPHQSVMLLCHQIAQLRWNLEATPIIVDVQQNTSRLIIEAEAYLLCMTVATCIDECFLCRAE